MPAYHFRLLIAVYIYLGADVSLIVALWFDDRGRVLRLEVEGAVTPDDAQDTVRVLDLQGF